MIKINPTTNNKSTKLIKMTGYSILNKTHCIYEHLLHINNEFVNIFFVNTFCNSEKDLWHLMYFYEMIN